MTRTITRATLAGVLALAFAGAAAAQTIPTPANPTPRFPVATDGTPLPRTNVDDGSSLLSGRSVFAPVAGVVGTGLGTANALVDGTVGAVGVR